MPMRQNVLNKCSSIASLVALLSEYRIVERKGLTDLFPSGFVNDKGGKHLPDSLGNEQGSVAQRTRY